MLGREAICSCYLSPSVIMSNKHDGCAEAAPDCILDRNRLRSTLEANDPRVLLEFYTLYFEQLRDFAQRITKTSFINDFEAVAQQAHKVKSSSYSVGALRVAELLTEAEIWALECNHDRLLNIVEVLKLDCAKTLELIEREIMALSN